VRAVARFGWRPAKLASVLAEGHEATESAVLQHLFLIDPLMRSSLDALGDNPRSHAAGFLLGLDADTAGRLRKHRRSAAARAMNLMVESFVKHHEPGILADLGVELYRLRLLGDAL